ncbi:unnamed protein product, partial [Prorocentrum cordatum]
SSFPPSARSSPSPLPAAFAAAVACSAAASLLGAGGGGGRPVGRCAELPQQAAGARPPLSAREARRVVELLCGLLFDPELEDIRLYDLSDAEESDVERSGGDATYGEMSFEMVVLHHGDIADDGGPQRNGTVVLFPNRLFEDSRKKHRREHQPFGSALGHPFWPGGAPGEFSADIQEGRR